MHQGTEGVGQRREEAGPERDEDRPKRGIVEANRMNEEDRSEMSQISHTAEADPKSVRVVDEVDLVRITNIDGHTNEADPTNRPKHFETGINRPAREDEGRDLVREANANDDLL